MRLWNRNAGVAVPSRMKTTTTIVFAALVLGCSDPDDTFRDGDRFTFLDESLDLIGVGTEPPEDHQVCCENGGCSPAVNGACPQGGVLHNCSDEEICNEDGSACWYECAPAQLPPMSSEPGASIMTDPSAEPMGEGCGSGACCTNGETTGVWICTGTATQDSCSGTWLSCDAGMCFTKSPCFSGVNSFSENCCSRG